MKIKLTAVSLMVILIMIGGCTSEAKNITESSESFTTAYPSSELTPLKTTYPVENSLDTSENNDFPVIQNPSLGAVSGTLLLEGEPVVDVSIYLGEIVSDEQGRELVAGYDRTSLVRAYTDDHGKFIIHNVPEGRYGLILDLVALAYLLDTPDGSQSLLLTVNGGETTDLGVLDYLALKGL